MNPEKMTVKTREALTGAYNIALENGNPTEMPEHILYALVADS